MAFVLIFIFGMLGGISRYEINSYLPTFGNFPLATLLINLLGCYLFTLLIKNYLVSKNINEKLIPAIGTGFIGSFTTFSSFMMDSDHLLESGNWLGLVVYVLLSILGGLFCALIGMKHGKRLRGAEND